MEYGYECDQCAGIVRSRLVEREAFKHKSGVVTLENVTVGICDGCGNRFYSADILHTVHETAIATEEYLTERAKRGSREKFLAAMAKVPDVEPPDPRDRLD